MAEIGGINNQSLYFAATQQASTQAARNQQAQKNEKSAASKKATVNSFQQQIQEQFFVNEGLPPELAGMTEEEAIIFLKDSVDITGDKLKENQSYENVESFRQSISSFIKYISKNNFEIVRKKRFRRDPYVTVQEINHHLTELTNGILYQNRLGSPYSRSNFDTLQAINRLKGMVVDLIAI